MGTRYEQDVVAWASEQAELLRSGNLTALDVEHIAEEIADVGKSEQRELASRMSVLLAHLLKWQFQPSHQSKSWKFTIRTQRKEIAYVLNEAPSLRGKFSDDAWLDIVWSKARSIAGNETGLDLDVFPEALPWSVDDVLSEDFHPAADGEGS
jgi:ribosomal protein L29